VRAKIDSEQALIRHIAAQYVKTSDYVNVNLAAEDMRARLQATRKRAADLAVKEREYEAKLSEEVRGGERMNEYLMHFFGPGHLEIRLRDEDKKYSLLRGGVKATNLSEGEKTAIAFSYFMAALEDKGVLLANTVVYIDDPISSLDSNHVYSTFAAIKYALSGCKQLFVATHNFEFFRLLKSDSFFHEMRDKKRVASFYIVRRAGQNESELADLPEELRKYNSEYHYLFSTLNAFRGNPNNFGHLIYSLPNMLRKVLEIYTGFRVANTAMSLDQRLARVIEDPLAVQKIYKFANHLSHSDGFHFAQQFPQIEECRETVELFFSSLQANDKMHYDGMMALM
jgi:wobble nucleotide-excising tRNase